MSGTSGSYRRGDNAPAQAVFSGLALTAAHGVFQTITVSDGVNTIPEDGVYAVALTLRGGIAQPQNANLWITGRVTANGAPLGGTEVMVNQTIGGTLTRVVTGATTFLHILTAGQVLGAQAARFSNEAGNAFPAGSSMSIGSDANGYSRLTAWKVSK